MSDESPLLGPTFAPLPGRVEVAVVGSGLAGLTAARRLARGGRDVHLFDPNPDPGGRVRTEVIDGHRLDLGFQVLLTGYPAVQEEVDLAALQLCSLEPGCVIVREGKHYSLPDPFRTPNRWMEAVLFPLATFADKFKTRSLRDRLKKQNPKEIFAAPERMAAAALRDLGFSERFLSTFWIPFFSAVFLDPPLEVTTRMFNFVFRSIALGDIALPRGGMGQIARQIAADLPAGCHHARTQVTGLKIENNQVRGLTVMSLSATHQDASLARTTPAGPAGDDAAPSSAAADRETMPPPSASPRKSEISAEYVILAAGPEEARQFAGVEIPALEPLGVSVVYFSIPHSVTQEKRIFLNGGGSSPAHHCIFLSNICSDYAPEGKQLLSATVLGTPESAGDALAERVRRQMSVWFPQGRVETWKWLATYKLPMAQFRQPPGLLGRLPGAITSIRNLYLAGDYTCHSSLQGALQSGVRAAEAILGAAS